MRLVDTVDGVARRLRDLVSLSGRDREWLVQAAKMAIAAVVAWLVARLTEDPQSFIAPYAAVFTIGGTVYRSLFDAARQVATLVLGVVVAFVVVLLVPWPPAALAVAVFAGMVVGRWHRLGNDGIWVGIVALLMVTYGTADDAGFLVYRIGEAVLGVVVGIAVNVLVLPPMHLRAAGRAVAGVSAEIEELLRSVADGLRDGWDQHDARRWSRRARAVETTVRTAEETAGDGRESTRFNPRWLWSRDTHPSTEDSALTVLYDVAKQTQHITETLVVSDDPDNTAPRTERAFDEMFAVLVTELARAVSTYRRPARDRELDRDALHGALRYAGERRAALAHRRPDQELPADWSAHAAALLAAERALQVLHAAVDG
ncbi:FUSC family protein [Actinophytocola sediminis]